MLTSVTGAVVNHPDLKPPNPYYVVQQEKWVCTRYDALHLCSWTAPLTANQVLMYLLGKLFDQRAD